MSSKKIERALYGPSTLEVALGALLGFLLGVALACVYLISKPVATVREMPAEPVDGVVYYLPGSSSGAKGSAWQVKQSQLISGKPVEVTEDELNAWANALGEPVKKTDGEGAAAEATPAAGWLTMSKPNFRIAPDRLQIGVPVKLDYFGLAFETTMLVSGNFVRESDRVVFNTEKVYLGSCPLHLLPGAANLAVGRLRSRVTVSDELRAAWARVHGVIVSGGALKVAVQ